ATFLPRLANSNGAEHTSDSRTRNRPSTSVISDVQYMPESHRAPRLRLLPSDSRHLRGGISRSLARKNASRVYIAGHLINEPDAMIPGFETHTIGGLPRRCR